ncbi:hypothetical protein GKE82_25300 [Conexibacter sp. W3-3-2]|uniref:hypothetical protein n=1 Tax=Conexibacter sp. W3-3-2 TaxID=2675227 RepID=UPI0012B89CFE|nr:hypothetical protein [Conexibacter sp. W3-3-2]MTD47524.1 hypothetical protein [Conexibacter sp. W3-3-2]
MASRTTVAATEGAVVRRPLQFVVYAPNHRTVLDVFDDEDPTVGDLENDELGERRS